MTKIRLLAVPAVLALALAACGEDDLQDSLADRSAAQAERELVEQKDAKPTPAPDAVKVEPSSAEADIDAAPKIPKGEGEPPSELVVQDLIEGSGKAAQEGDKLTVEYVGVRFEDGKQFDSSWGEGRDPLEFTLGTDNVIEGWHQGLVGMKVGGRRKLIIPPDLAYGAQGSGEDIPANATLIFDIDLKKVG